MFFAKNGKNINFPGWNAIKLEIKPRAQRGMTFAILALNCNMTSKILTFLGRTMGFRSSKNISFFSRFFTRSLAKSRRAAIRPTVLIKSHLGNCIIFIICTIYIDVINQKIIFLWLNE